MSSTPFGEIQGRHILHGFLAIHQELAELESLTSQGSRSSPFSQYVNDLSPTEVRVLLDHFARIRAAMLAHLEELAIPVEVGQTSLRWALQTRLVHVSVGIDEHGAGAIEGIWTCSMIGRATRSCESGTISPGCSTAPCPALPRGLVATSPSG